MPAGASIKVLRNKNNCDSLFDQKKVHKSLLTLQTTVLMIATNNTDKGKYCTSRFFSFYGLTAAASELTTFRYI